MPIPAATVLWKMSFFEVRCIEPSGRLPPTSLGNRRQAAAGWPTNRRITALSPIFACSRPNLQPFQRLIRKIRRALPLGQNPTSCTSSAGSPPRASVSTSSPPNAISSAGYNAITTGMLAPLALLKEGSLPRWALLVGRALRVSTVNNLAASKHLCGLATIRKWLIRSGCGCH
jgi:hypothetical protein